MESLPLYYGTHFVSLKNILDATTRVNITPHRVPFNHKIPLVMLIYINALILWRN